MPPPCRALNAAVNNQTSSLLSRSYIPASVSICDAEKGQKEVLLQVKRSEKTSMEKRYLS